MHADAIQDFDYSISQRPNNVTALYYRSLSYHQLGRLHNALDDLNQVLNYDPSLIPALFIRADVLRSLNQIEDAIKDARLSEDLVSKPETGIIMGSGGPSTKNIVQASETLKTKGAKQVGPFMVPRAMSSSNSATLATYFKIKCFNYSISSISLFESFVAYSSALNPL